MQSSMPVVAFLSSRVFCLASITSRKLSSRVDSKSDCLSSSRHQSSLGQSQGSLQALPRGCLLETDESSTPTDQVHRAKEIVSSVCQDVS